MGKQRRRKQRQRTEVTERAASPASYPSENRPLVRRDIILAAVLAVAVLAVYGTITDHQFINYDDPRYVSENEAVQRGLDAESVRWALTQLAPFYWQPLTWLSHMLDIEMYGLHAGRHLLTNVLFHAASSVCLFLLLLKASGLRWPSFLAAALFALHPLRVESVAWAAERKDVLSTFFLVLTLWAYVAYGRRRSLARYLLVTLSLSLGLMSKPALVTVPILLLFFDYWPLRRFHGLIPPRQLIIEKIPWLILVLLVSFLTVEGQQQAISPLSHIPMSQRFQNMAVSSMMYVVKTVVPTHLAILYPYPARFPIWQVVLGVSMVSTLTVLAWRYRSRFPYVWAGWLWFLVALLPVIGLIQAGSQSYADRFTYIPHIGLFAAVCWLGFDIASRDARMGEVLKAGSVAVLLVLAILSWRQLHTWKDSETVFRHALRVTRNNVVAHLRLADALDRQNRRDEADIHYRQAVLLSPRSPLVRHDYGHALLMREKYREAAEEFRQSIAANPRFASAHHYLGEALLKNGQIDEAVASLQTAARLDPDSARIHNDLGSALGRQGDSASAISQYQEAIRLDPRLFDAHMNLGAVLGRERRVEEALASFSRAAEIQPGSPEPLVYMALTLAQAGRIDQALSRAADAYRIDQKRSDEILASAIRVEPRSVTLMDFLRARVR